MWSPSGPGRGAVEAPGALPAPSRRVGDEAARRDAERVREALDGVEGHVAQAPGLEARHGRLRDAGGFGQGALGQAARLTEFPEAKGDGRHGRNITTAVARV